MDSATGTGERGNDSKHVSFRRDIEGLRGVAILLVVGFHLGSQLFPGGFVGVDVFFVLSGYLITDLIVREIDRTGTVDFAGFFARRVRRLLPASSLVLLTTIVASYFVFSPLEQVRISGSAIATAGYLSNAWFMRAVTDYFGPGAHLNPLLHTWSLAVEEQFYLFWPCVVFLVARRAPERMRRNLFAAVAFVSVVSFGTSIWLTRWFEPWAFFGSPTRAWEFGVGAVGALVMPMTGGITPRLRVGTGWLGLFAIMLAAIWLTPAIPFPGVAAILPVAGTAAVLVDGTHRSRFGVGRVLGTPVLQLFGRLSYSWYLWHWPLLVLGVAVFPAASLYGRGLLALGALILAAATHLLVENPIRFNPGLVRRPYFSLGLAAVSVAVMVYAGAAWGKAARRELREEPQRLYARAAEDLSFLSASSTCTAAFRDDSVSECVFGDSLSTSEVVLFGDSHADQWGPALDEIGKRAHWRIRSITKASCTPVQVSVHSRRFKRTYSECGRWRERAILRIRELRPSAILVTGFSMAEPKRLSVAGRYLLLSEREWQDGVKSTLDNLAPSGASMVFLLDTPHPRIDIPVCLSRIAARKPSSSEGCSVWRSIALDETARRAERAAIRDVEGASFVDLSDEICGPVWCDPVRNGLVVYRDTNHLTATFVRSLSHALANRLIPLVQ